MWKQRIVIPWCAFESLLRLHGELNISGLVSVAMLIAFARLLFDSNQPDRYVRTVDNELKRRVKYAPQLSLEDGTITEQRRATVITHQSTNIDLLISSDY
jgi:hypothetical protein